VCVYLYTYVYIYISIYINIPLYMYLYLYLYIYIYICVYIRVWTRPETCRKYAEIGEFVSHGPSRGETFFEILNISPYWLYNQNLQRKFPGVMGRHVVTELGIDKSMDKNRATQNIFLWGVSVFLTMQIVICFFVACLLTKKPTDLDKFSFPT